MICNLPKVTGTCRGSFRKYYFDSKTQQCLSFNYGGCEGNANRFNTTDECQQTCGSVTATSDLGTE